jgi:hypothetical protein
MCRLDELLAKGRWTPRRKASLLDAISSGALSAAVACARWQISQAELGEWLGRYARYGVGGLKATWRRDRRDHGATSRSSTTAARTSSYKERISRSVNAANRGMR